MVSETDGNVQAKMIKGSSRLSRTFRQDQVALAVNAYLMAGQTAQSGDNKAVTEAQQEQLAVIQKHYWEIFFSILSANISSRGQSLEFSNDERLFMDLGLVDARMLSGDREQITREALAEMNLKSGSGCYYLTEWLMHRYQQLQLESSLSSDDKPKDRYASQLSEVRTRVLVRLSGFFQGLPGIPRKMADSMCSGDLDKAVIASGIHALHSPRRKNLLRRRSLWLLREQILAKARARANNQASLRLFELLNEVYSRDWQERYESFLQQATQEKSSTLTMPAISGRLVPTTGADNDLLMCEARQIHMRMALMAAIDGENNPNLILAGAGPRLTKAALNEFLPVVNAFDRSLAELPPILLLPGQGRGFFAWETGCVMLALRPLIGVDDSVATAFGRLRMLDDHLNKDGKLRQAYEKRFPGGVFQSEFPADYRAWLCRLSKGESGAMSQERRAFFREYVGPDVSGPILPPNLRNIGPQTLAAICRRLEKQIDSGERDVNLHRRLASIYWQQGNLEAAGMQFTAAMREAPKDGETLFAAGMFMRSRDDNEAANDCFRYGAERAANSLWGIYCQDALANLL
ncbi:MAG: hypothetical protein FWG74_04235 [Planctomycetes bacterium]|nr:hypothetical protein [Planctomycetota bacterium]